MKYFRAYLAALREIVLVLGVALFMADIVTHRSFTAMYLLYLASIAALAGPLKIVLEKK